MAPREAIELEAIQLEGGRLSLVELAKYATRIEAEVARITLEANGIDAVLFDAETGNFFGGGGLVWIRLMVLDDEVDEAGRILAEDRPS